MIRKPALPAPGSMLRIAVISAVLLGIGLNGLVAQTTRPVAAGPSWKNRLASGLAAAAVGAGLGYFASQLARGDWEEGGGRREINRSTWAAVGGVGGFALGISIPVWGRPPGRESSVPTGEERFVITGEEIREASVTNALEAVRLFHPEWLVQRGQEAFVTPESDDIRVYLDNLPLGGIETLQGVSPLSIDFIRFYDPRSATARWGAGHTHGAIQVVTLD